MNIYKISQSERSGYDTFDSAIVTAENEEQARIMHPLEYNENPQDDWYDDWMHVWASKPENVKVELIGISKSNVSEFVLKSFNAG